jgi:hypothetical protein
MVACAPALFAPGWKQQIKGSTDVKSILLAAAVIGGLGCATPARATIISATYDFTASFARVPSGFVNPLMGSFTLTFDNSVGDITNSTVGLTVNSLNYPNAASINTVFSYTKLNDQLVFGGDLNGASSINPGTNDFGFAALNVSGAPFLSLAAETVPGATVVTITGRGTVTVTRAISEPMGLALLGVGLLGLVAVRRKTSNVSSHSA